MKYWVTYGPKVVSRHHGLIQAVRAAIQHKKKRGVCCRIYFAEELTRDRLPQFLEKR